MTVPVLASIQVGLPRCLGQDGAEESMDRPWTTGFIKEPVFGAVWLGSTNLDGDGQADLVHHGGPDKGVLAYSAEHYPGWRLSMNNPSLAFGAFGENFTVHGLTEADVCIGDTWHGRCGMRPGVAASPAMLEAGSPLANQIARLASSRNGTNRVVLPGLERRSRECGHVAFVAGPSAPQVDRRKPIA